MKKLLKYKIYTTSLIPFIFILSILVARYYGGHLLFHSLAEIFSIFVGFIMIVIVSYTYQFTKNNFLLYLGIGYFWISILDLFHMLTYQGMSIYPTASSNVMLTFWLSARLLEAFVLFTAIFINFQTVSKLRIFILFGLATATIYALAFSQYVPTLYEQGGGLTSLKINLEYTIILILMITIFLYTKRKKEFDKSIYYYIIASIILTVLTEFTLTFYAKVDDYFTILAHLLKFLSYWMIFLSIIKISLEKPFKLLAHESSTYNSIPFPSILVDSKGIIRQVNDSTASFLNLEKEKIINQNNHMLFHNKEIREYECEVCKAIKSGYTLLSYHLQRATSTYSCTVNPIQMEKTTLGSVQVCIDISQQFRKEVELRVSENKSRNLIEKMMNAFALHEMIFNENDEAFDYRFLEVNPAWENIIGLKSEQVIGKTILQVFPGVKDIWINIYERVVRTGISEEFEQYSPVIQKYFHCYAYRPEAGKFAVFFNDTTQRKKDELLLIESEKRLHLIIENSPVGICTVDLLGNFISTNLPYEKMLGYSKKELKELSFFDITHPDYRPKNKELFQKMFSLKASGFNMEKVYIRKDTREINVSVHATGINDEMGKRKFGIAFVEDITEKKNAVELLEQKKNELESIITNAPNPMILHEESGKVLMLNQAWINSSGFSLKEIPTISDWIKNVFDSKDQLFMTKHIDSLYKITEKIDEGEFTFFNKNKELVTWQVSSAPLGLIDAKRTVITSAMDVTELKHKDEMLINQSRHAAMGEMISMIAHQWRQPISTISMDANNMLLDIAIDNFSISASEEYANSIAKQTQHLSKTIDDFRNFFKPDKVISKVNISDVIDQTLTIVKDSLTNNNIELKISFETDKEVYAYPRELMQVFANIITNSKDALVHNKVKNSQINIKVYEDEKYLNTEICDNGGGIDSNILSKIFDPYFSTKDEKTGTGLGLYMSKMIIEEHLNGIIDASNGYDGACLTIRLMKEEE